MLPRYVLYGCAGWVLEVCFTGMENALKGDRTGTAKTYLWMHPIYGASALGLEYLQERLRFLPRLTRALAYTAVIFGAEFVSGWLLRKALGRCPWDYDGKGWSVKGLIRLDYAPFWYATALLFEPMHDAFLLVTREALRHAPQPTLQAPPPPGAAAATPSSPPAGPGGPHSRESVKIPTNQDNWSKRFRGWMLCGRAPGLTLPFLSATGAA